LQSKINGPLAFSAERKVLRWRGQALSRLSRD
jgi:hypothetical protein